MSCAWACALAFRFRFLGKSLPWGRRNGPPLSRHGTGLLFFLPCYCFLLAVDTIPHISPFWVLGLVSSWVLDFVLILKGWVKRGKGRNSPAVRRLCLHAPAPPHPTLWLGNTEILRKQPKVLLLQCTAFGAAMHQHPACHPSCPPDDDDGDDVVDLIVRLYPCPTRQGRIFPYPLEYATYSELLFTPHSARPKQFHFRFSYHYLLIPPHASSRT